MTWLRAMGSCPAPRPSSSPPPASLYSFTRRLSCSAGLNFRTFPFQETEIGTKTPFSFQIPCKAAFFHLIPQITVSEPHSHTESPLQTYFFPHQLRALCAQLAPNTPCWGAQVSTSPAKSITACLAGEGRTPLWPRDNLDTSTQSSVLGLLLKEWSGASTAGAPTPSCSTGANTLCKSKDIFWR